MKKHYFDPYVNPFVKMGRRTIWTNDPETYFYNNHISGVRNQRADFTDYGIALGFRHDFGVSDRFGVDINIGAVYRETRLKYQEQYDYDNLAFVEQYSGTSHSWRGHIRLNLYVKLFELK